MANLDDLQSRPETLWPAAVGEVLKPDGGVAPADLNAQFQPDATIILTPSFAASNRPDWRYYGHAVASYQPLNLTDVFGTQEIRLKVDPSVRPRDIAAQLATIFQVNLTAADVLDEAITVTPGMTYLLKANTASTMWRGFLKVRLFLHFLNETSA